MIIYNLSFSPSLTLLDLSNTNIDNNYLFFKNLGKILNISTTIKYIILKNLSSYENIKIFFNQIKTSSSIEVLDLN